jgi:hypothetical protein
VITANGGCKEVEGRRSIWKRCNVVLDLRDNTVLVLCYDRATKRRLDLMRVSEMRIYSCVYYDTPASIAEQEAILWKV